MQYMNFSCARADTGAALPNASITVYVAGTNTTTALYDVNGIAISNPVTAATNGAVGFACVNGIYDIQITSADGVYIAPLWQSVQIYDFAALGSGLRRRGNWSNVAADYVANDAVLYTDGNDYYVPATFTGAVTTGTAPGSSPWVLDASGSAATLAGHFANDNTNAAVPGQADATARGAKYWATQANASLTTLTGMFSALAPETGFQGGFLDSTFQLSFGAKLDGSFYATKWAAAMIPGTALKAGTVTYSLLDASTVTPFMLASLPPESGFFAALMDALFQAAIAAKLDGSVVIPKLVLNPGAVNLSNLAAGVLSLMFSTLPPESGFQGAFMDSQNQVALGFKLDGSLVGRFSGALSPGSVSTVYLQDGAVTEAKLNGPVQRLAMPHAGDVVEVMPDAWRAKYGPVGSRTGVDGTFWTQCPPVKTQTLRGLNKSGTTIVFRRSAKLLFRGKRFGSNWNPLASGAVNSTNLLGPVTSAQLTAGLSTVGRTLGDYYRYFSVANVTYNAVTVNLGDIVVYDGAAWQVQKAPAPVGSSDPTTRRAGDWWIVTTAGTFGGVAYAIGDRIVYLGYDSNSGSGYALWYKGQPTNGELFYYGEFAPGSTLAASYTTAGTAAQDGDVWQASASGTDTTTGFTLASGDYVLRDLSTWGAITGSSQISVANNAMIPALPCYAMADEWEFRRSDKSATRVAVIPSARIQREPRRSVDGIFILGDSMPGVANLATNLGTLVAPRTVSVISRGGGIGDDVIGTLTDQIANLGDAYKAMLWFMWWNQNNASGTWNDINWTQAQETVLQAMALIGSDAKRACVLSVKGTDPHTWNGTRLVSSLNENWATNSYGPAGYEGWLASTFPGQWLSVRSALIAGATSVQDTRVPFASVGGASQLTEAQTAALYGWVPQTFWGQTGGTWPFYIKDLSLKGYWNNTALPTGGTALDCYTRNGNSGTAGSGSGLGNLLVNVSGTWTEYAYDATHLNPSADPTQPGGGKVLGAAMYNSYLLPNLL